jgi:hypothetical protein
MPAIAWMLSLKEVLDMGRCACILHLITSSAAHGVGPPVINPPMIKLKENNKTAYLTNNLRMPNLLFSTFCLNQPGSIRDRFFKMSENPVPALYPKAGSTLGFANESLDFGGEGSKDSFRFLT